MYAKHSWSEINVFLKSTWVWSRQELVRVGSQHDMEHASFLATYIYKCTCLQILLPTCVLQIWIAGLLLCSWLTYYFTFHIDMGVTQCYTSYNPQGTVFGNCGHTSTDYIPCSQRYRHIHHNQLIIDDIRSQEMTIFVVKVPFWDHVWAVSMHKSLAF